MKRRFLLTIIGLWACVATFSQTAVLPTINLQGQARAKVMPDVAVIDFHINSKAKLENEALAKLNVANNKLVERLVALGFSKDQIRITNFYIQEDHIYTEGNPRKIGYIASQSLSLRFPYDKEKLTNLFGKLSSEQTENTNVGFSTEISEQLEKTTRESLIEKALQDARDKAEIIARTSRLKILSVHKIEYGAIDSPIYPPMMKQEYRRMEGAASAPTFATINANEIMISERINVSYLVENVK